MSYTALYRKWRPRSFDDVKGQDAICTTLKNQINTGRIGHAYLFCGTRGTGKTSVAKIMARAVNCANNDSGNPCNECLVCQSILKDNSLNVIEIDAASNNGVDNIREIREQVKYPPTEGKYRVFIIDEVHMLSTGAFNALLKTLEEPPDYVIFILATTEVHKIPITVLSRCQRYDFKRISVDIISERLKELAVEEKIVIEDKAINYIAKSADGAMRDALSLMDECIAFHPDESISYDQVLEILGAADISIFKKLFDAVISDDTTGALTAIEEIIELGKDLNQFVNDYLWYLRNILIVKTADDAEGIVDCSRETMEIMRSDASKITKEQLMRHIRVFAELSNSIRYATQKRVLTELAIIKMTTPQMEENYDSVIERLAKIEKRLDSGELVAKTSSESLENYLDNDNLDKKTSIKTTFSKPVQLPKAQYEDLMLIRNDWSKIMNSIGGSVAATYKDTIIEPAGDNVLRIVFATLGTYQIGSRENVIKEITDFINERYKKSFSFITRAKQEGERLNTNYVSEEEVKTLVHTEIEITNE